MNDGAPDMPFAVAGGAHAIIAGFGLPGRAAAERFDAAAIPYCVIELNAATVRRAAKSGAAIIEGDVADERTLRRAGIGTARILVIAIPQEQSAVEATALAHRLNPSVRIITRCHYTSKGLEAKSRGAAEVVIAEQVVATAISSLIEEVLNSVNPAEAPVATVPPRANQAPRE